MGGLRERLPVTSTTSLIASLAVSGVPPLNGFWSKLIIIFAAVISGRYVYAFLAVIVSVLTISYFMRMQRYGFYGRLREDLAGVKEVPALMRTSMVLLALVVVFVGLLFPYVIKYMIDPAVNVLLNGVGYSRVVLGG